MTITEVFEKTYPTVKDNVKSTFCPYRVCPIGAHSDHQYGLISGFALDRGIHIMYTPTSDGTVELHSMNFAGDHSFNINDLPRKQDDWADYLRGAVYALRINHKLKCGIRAVINGTLPIGGLSSSAAVVIAFLSAICHANGIHIQNHEVINTAMAAENTYVGINCGKLDQSCEVFAKKDHLLFLDTKDDTYELIPQNPNMKPYEIAIFFSGVQRTLVGTMFNMRVDEMKSASYALKAFAGLQYGKFVDSRLRDVPREIYDVYKSRLPENWMKRAEHFYGEMDRVRRGVEAWRQGDIEKYGKLSFESGYSSIYNYETGSPELKALYDIMRETDGIYGGRFSGAGFKGCCMALVDPSFKKSINETVTKRYLERFPSLAGSFSIHYCSSADGCRF